MTDVSIRPGVGPLLRDWRQRTRLAPFDADYYKHPDPFANTTTRGTRRKRAPSKRYRDEDGRRVWTDEQLKRAWPRQPD